MQKRLTHTPGPWTLQGEGIVNDPTTGRPLLTTRIETAGGWGMIEILDGTNEPDGNACLIAAAPELMTALQDLLAVAQKSLDQSATHDGLNNCDTLARARAAIIKATR